MLEEIKTYFGDLSGASINVIVIFSIIFIALLINFFWKIFHRKLTGQLEKTKNIWDDSFVLALDRPVSLAIWILGLTFALEYALTANEFVYYDKISLVRRLLLVVILGWFALRFTILVEQKSIEKAQAEEESRDATTIHAMGKLVRVSIVITTVLVILQNLNISISGVLAFGGIGGIAVGFAAKDLLANFFGGLMIYLDRPFSVGDWIRSPDRNLEGTVEHIGWRQTRIRTFDKRPLYVPNATFNNIAVENPSRMLNRRIYETIGVRYCDSRQVESIVSAVETMLREHESIDQNATLIVNFNAFAPSSLDFFVYTFTKTTNWVEFHGIKQDVLLRILKIIHDHGADIAFPTSTVHLKNETEALGET